MKSTHNGEVRITSLIVDELAKALRKILKLDGPADVLMSLYFKTLVISVRAKEPLLPKPFTTRCVISR